MPSPDVGYSSTALASTVRKPLVRVPNFHRNAIGATEIESMDVHVVNYIPRGERINDPFIDIDTNS